MDKQNQRGKQSEWNDGDDDDFYCAKFRNDPSFLRDDNKNEMKGKDGSPQTLNKIYLPIIIILHFPNIIFD